MEIDLTGIVVIVGNYGSGKTEVSINLAIDRNRSGIDVRLADLDLVNPYFRTREAATVLNRMGIDVVLPPANFLRADLPILNPAVAGMIRQPSQLTLIDVGGDDVGATVLASLADAFKGKTPQVLQVVNPLRPFTESIEGCLKIRNEIEKASKMTITGMIGNTNLIDETTPKDIKKGYDFITNLAKESGLPVKFITAPSHLISKIELDLISCPVLSIERQLVPPWKKAKTIV